MKIRQVTLTVDGVGEAADAYRDVLQLPVTVQAGQAHVQVGRSRVVLSEGEPFHGVHHLAFGIAPADLELARAWLEDRVELIEAEGVVVLEGPVGWHSWSLYWIGPEGVLLELIARDADAALPASTGAVPRLLSVSEVGIGVPDVAEAVRTLARQLDLPPFPPHSPGFAPVGGHDGLVVLVDHERTWWPSHHAPPARGPVAVELQAPRAGRVSLTADAGVLAV